MVSRSSCGDFSLLRLLVAALLVSSSLPSLATAYRPGDIVPMLRAGQYHGSRTLWFDVVGRHCPAFAVNREVLMPIPKPTGYTGADPYKICRGSSRHKEELLESTALAKIYSC